MEKSTIVGIILGFLALIGGMMLKGADPLAILQNPAAIVIILVGTVASVTIAFPGYELKKIPTLLKLVFVPQKLMPKKEVIRLFMEWATITRREGLLALESHIEEIDDPFLKNGMRMIIDGNDQEFVRDVLMEELHATEERHKAGASIFSQAGTYAPTLGVLGAVIGLVAALSNMTDSDQLAHSISAAFIATLLGIFTGYVLWHPIANKLRRLSKREIELKLMMVEGLLSIQSGVSTIAINQKLSVYLSPAERAEDEKKGEAADGEKVQPA
jgi:chemotaxis protein MotA